MVSAPLDASTSEGRLALATRTAHACVAGLPEILDGSFFVVVMHGTDPVARHAATHIARAARDADLDRETPGLSASLDARPAPREVVLELRDRLGAPLTTLLEAPLAERHVRVLWLTSEDHTVFDVPIETSHVVEFEKELDPPDEALRIEADELGREERDVAGTWQDPSRYLPLPLPKGWVIDGIDKIGVLTVIVDDRLVIDLCATEMPEKVLFAALRRTMSRGTVVNDEARRVLDRLRNVRRPFKDLRDDDLIKRIFGESRVWAALVVESAETERGRA